MNNLQVEIWHVRQLHYFECTISCGSNPASSTIPHRCRTARTATRDHNIPSPQPSQHHEAAWVETSSPMCTGEAGGSHMKATQHRLGHVKTADVKLDWGFRILKALPAIAGPEGVSNELIAVNIYFV